MQDREADRQSLAKKSYEYRLEKLASDIGPRYGVEIYVSEEGRHPKDQLKTLMVRKCPKHGEIEVRLAAFVTRGNFGCHLCINEEQAEAARKPEALKASVSSRETAHTYLAISKCGNYVKVGQTSQKPVTRLRQVNDKSPIDMTSVRYTTTTGERAALVETLIKRALARFLATELGDFVGGKETFNLGKAGLTVSDVVLKLKSAIGKKAEASDGSVITFGARDLDFCEEVMRRRPPKPKKVSKERSMASNSQEAARKAKVICEQNGTTLQMEDSENVLLIHVSGTAGKSKVRKLCTTNPTHKSMDVTIGSIIHSGRVGCATCARIKGGQKSRK